MCGVCVCVWCGVVWCGVCVCVWVCVCVCGKPLRDTTSWVTRTVSSATFVLKGKTKSAEAQHQAQVPRKHAIYEAQILLNAALMGT